jgi:hypothetical protein
MKEPLGTTALRREQRERLRTITATIEPRKNVTSSHVMNKPAVILR